MRLLERWRKKRIEDVTKALIPPEIVKETDKKKMLLSFQHGKCPDCASADFYFGPSGGAAQNVRCAKCMAEFNLAIPFFVERITRR